MKVIYRLLIFSCFLSLTNCTKVKNQKFSVIYEIAVDSEIPYKILIMYKDSSEYITVYTNTDWQKEVNLSLEDIVSLTAIPQICLPENEAGWNLLNQKEISISAKIICNNKTMINQHSNRISISIPIKTMVKDIEW